MASLNKVRITDIKAEKFDYWFWIISFKVIK